MNIFVVQSDPIQAAKDLPDKHVVKMTLESAQLLSTVANLKGFNSPYRPTHINHPATRWVAISSANWNWLIEHGLALAAEYTNRYNKIHRCQAVLSSLQNHTVEIWKENKPFSEHTVFAQCMPIQYQQSDPVLAYRTYFCAEKRNMATWKSPAKPPTWFY